MPEMIFCLMGFSGFSEFHVVIEPSSERAIVWPFGPKAESFVCASVVQFSGPPFHSRPRSGNNNNTIYQSYIIL